MKFPIPAGALAQHIAILGKTGSGKTSTGKLVVEHVVEEGARVCILDPIKSDWWGLISSASGKTAGLPFYILGGPRGHVPVHAAAGKAVAEIVANGSLPHSIIDMADFEPGGHAKFFTKFAPTLLRRMKGVLYLVIEEAHLFAPKERSGIGEENMSIHWAKTLATAGRSKGIRLMVLTQRTQALHNALLGSCDTLIAHRMTAPADQEPVFKWLKANVPKDEREQVEASLSSLQTGEGWICSGEAKVFKRAQFPRIKTYDNTATPTDDDSTAEVKTAAVDPDKLIAIIGEAVKEAQANDPAELRKRIRELERQLAAKPAGKATDTTVERAVANAHRAWESDAKKSNAARDRLIAALRDALGNAMKLIVNINAQDFFGKDGAKPDQEKLEAAIRAAMVEVERQVGAKLDGQQKAFEAWRREGQKLLKRIEALLADGELPVDVTVRQQTSIAVERPRPLPERAAPRPAAASNGTGEHLPRGEAVTLTACIQFPDGLRREQLTVLTGYKRSSRDTYIQKLRERGYVEVQGDRVVATESGLAAIPNAEPLPTGPALQDYWLAKLPEGERKILAVLIERAGAPVLRSELDELTGYQRSSRDTYLQKLRAKQLVVDVGRGEVQASENLF